MDKKQIKESVIRALDRLYQKYKDDGLSSIYLYGSITGPDFNPESSDVDTISIWKTAPSNPKKMEAKLNAFLSEQPEFIPGFSTRILPRQELLDTSIKESSLTFFIPNEALLLDLPYWELVAGEDVSSYGLPQIPYKEGVETGLKVLKKWNWLTNDAVEPNKINNYLKVLARMLWSIDGMNGNTYPFSYTKLANRSDEYLTVAKKILESKKLHWPEDHWTENKQLFQDFIDPLVCKYSHNDLVRNLAIGFDWGGVLNGKPSQYFNAEISSTLEVPVATYQAAWQKHNHHINTGTLSAHETWKLVLKELGHEDKLADAMAVSARYMADSPNHDVIAIVDELRKLGYKIGLLSNNTTIKGQELRNSGLHKHFDVFHISAETGLMKPNPEAFERLCAELGIQMSHLVFVDDSPKSLSTAEECGFTGILFESAEQLRKDLRTLGLIE